MRWSVFIACLAGVAMAGSCRPSRAVQHWAFLAGKETPSASPRPTYWAKWIHSDSVANLYQVSPNLFRGSEPTSEGMKHLAALGVRTVVNMRSMHDTGGRTKGLGLAYHCIKMKAWEPRDEEVIEFLRIATDRTKNPVFVHCYTGGDRAGLVAAAYRIVVQGWDKEDAIAEMQYGGFAYHALFDRWYPQYIRNMDVDDIRRQVGLPPKIVSYQTARQPDGRLSPRQQ